MEHKGFWMTLGAILLIGAVANMSSEVAMVLLVMIVSTIGAVGLVLGIGVVIEDSVERGVRRANEHEMSVEEMDDDS